MRRFIFLIIFFVVFLKVASYGENTKKTIAAGLLSSKPLERQAIFNQVLEQRAKTIEELLSILNKEDVDRSFNGPLHRAIELLGRLRAKESVEVLSKFLTYVPEGYATEEDIPTEAYYVSAVALIEIGEPSIPSMLTIIKETPSKIERNIATWVIMGIEGKEQALNRIKNMIEIDKVHKENFLFAKEYMENYKVTFGNPLFKDKK